MPVLALGVACWDILGTFAGFPPPNGKVRTTSLVEAAGGNAQTAAATLGRLGAQVSLISALGKDDAHGALLVEHLKRCNVDTSRLQLVPDHPTAFSYVIVTTDGSRTCLHTGGPEVAPCNASVLDGGYDLVFLDGRFFPAALQLAKDAEQRNVSVLLDHEKEDGDVLALLRLATYSTHSEEESASQEQLVAANLEILEQNPRLEWTIATWGRNGSVLTKKSDKTSLVCRPRGGVHAWQGCTDDPPNGTGAGDVFCAGLCFALQNKYDEASMLQFASALAAGYVYCRTNVCELYSVETLRRLAQQHYEIIIIL